MPHIAAAVKVQAVRLPVMGIVRALAKDTSQDSVGWMRSFLSAPIVLKCLCGWSPLPKCINATLKKQNYEIQAKFNNSEMVRLGRSRCHHRWLDRRLPGSICNHTKFRHRFW